MAQAAHAVLPGELGTQRRQLTVGEPRALGPAQQRRVEHRRVFDLPAQLAEPGDLLEEPRVDSGAPRQFRDTRAVAQRPLDGVDPPLGGASGDRRARALGSGETQNPPRPSSMERSALPSASANERPSAIASPTLFIVVVSSGSAPGNFSKANRGTLTTT